MKSKFFKQSLFKPAVIRASGKKKLTLGENFQEDFGTTHPSGSFRFDPVGTGLKNTQQLNVDFSKFENHTFFNSAKQKLHVGFDRIINQFPFDGTRAEYETFLDSLTGFEKYLLDTHPKNTGFLLFDRPPTLSDGNFLEVADARGISEVKGNKNNIGESILSIGEQPFTIETSVFVPSGTQNYNEVIAQRLSGSVSGFTLALSNSLGTSSPSGVCDVFFALSDRTNNQKAVAQIRKGHFTHIAAVYDRGNSNRLKILEDGEVKGESPGAITVSDINFSGTKFLIGTGTNHTLHEENFEVQKTLSGALDEFRFFNSSRERADIREYRNQEIFAQPDLQLCFRFNEPSGSYGASTGGLCLDHSGKGLHTAVTNFSASHRETSKITAPVLIKEDSQMSPILFPSHELVQARFSTLISSATNYDYSNPNLITNLVPRHYFDDELGSSYAQSEGLLEKLPSTKFDQPGGSVIKQSHLISSVLFMWAGFFDEIKMYIDEMGRLLKVDYVKDETIASQFLPFLARYHGFALPSQFNNATIEQMKQGRNVTVDDARANNTLQEIQNSIWRRILTELPSLRKSKGTRNSIEGLLRSIGMNPGSTFRIKEYGGVKTKEISNQFEKRTQVGAMIRMSGSLSKQGNISSEGKDDSRPLITTSYLSGSRVEPGKPEPRGSFVSGVSNQTGDGLMTSGSWHFEGVYRFPGNVQHPEEQSLARIQTTGSTGGTGNTWVTFNLVASKGNTSNSATGSVVLHGKPNGTTTTPGEFQLVLSGVNIFNGQKWHVSFGRAKNDELKHVSSSYYLRVGKSNFSSDSLVYSRSLYFDDKEDNTLNVINPEWNASGSYITIGSMSLGYNTSAPYSFLNNSSYKKAKILNFTGDVGNVRFFTKDMSVKETITHIENPRSLGVENPSLNYNYNTTNEGSFERLRLDYSMNQMVTETNGVGNIEIFDFSRNNLIGTGTGFEKSGSVIFPERYDFRTLTSKIDTFTNENKVRIRSFKSQEFANRFNTQIAPVYQIPPAEKPFDDRRVAIEISSVQALNDDIALIFSSLDYFDNAIGDPELIFSSEYKSLRDLRRIYFNRLDDKVSFIKFFSFFKWFDDTVGDILEQMIPSTSKYLGTNFVIESHALERPKFVYSHADMYLGELERPNPAEIYLKQLIANIRKR